MNHCMENPKDALRFLLAGNAYVTIVSKKTGVRYTYRVSKPKKEESLFPCPHCKKKPCVCEEVHFVSLLTGPDNQSSYTYLGIIRSNAFQLTRKSKMTSASAPVVAFSFVFNMLKQNKMNPLVEVWHQGRCGRCGRQLTVPEYKVDGVVVAGIALGIGPECSSYLGG